MQSFKLTLLQAALISEQDRLSMHTRYLVYMAPVALQPG